MAKITINSITSGFASNTLLNTNFSALTSELNNKVLYRNNPVGEPNSMMNDLDMNSNDILNVNDVYADNVILNGVAIAASAVALPIASETILGVAELATDAEAQAKTGDVVIKASNLAALNATETMSGLVEKATTAEAKAATANKFPDAAGVKSYVDQFGLGTTETTLYNGVDANTFLTAGTYAITNGINLPTTSTYTLHVKSGPQTGRVVQMAHGTHVTTPINRIWTRTSTAGGAAWSSWVEIYHTGNILGTVSQSGGIPTGAIIESGSNANGEYVKYADGTMICTHAATINTACTSTGGAMFAYFGQVVWTFPIAFLSIAYAGVSGKRGGYTTFTTISDVGIFSISAFHQSNISFTEDILYRFYAIGRWY